MVDNIYPANFKTKVYQPRELSSKQIAFCEAYIAGNSITKSMQLAGYKSDTNSHLLKCKRIRDYIANRQGKMVNVPVTFESKLNDIATIIDETLHGKVKNYGAGLSAIAEANKMQGHYAATKNLNVNANIEVDNQQASALFNKLLEQSKSDY